MKYQLALIASLLALAASAEYKAVATEQYSDAELNDSNGNVIKANRDLTSPIETFVGGELTLMPSRVISNKWEASSKYLLWNGSVWSCSGFESKSTVVILEGAGATATKIAIVQPTKGQVDLVRTGAIRNDGKLVASEDINRQIIFDLCYPVNSIWIQYTSSENPNTLFSGKGITCTWTDITGTFSTRFFQPNSSYSAGSFLSETLPNIKGSAEFEVYSGSARPVINLAGWGGCFVDGGTTSSKTYMTGVGTSTFSRQKKLGFNANYSSSVYQDSAAVRPYTSTVKVWRRTK